MDVSLLRAVNALAHDPAIAALAVALSSRWMLLLACGPAFAWLLRRRRLGPVVAVVLAMSAADLVSSRVVKPLVARERPCRALEGLAAPTSCGPGMSFPSSHATVAFAFLTSAAPAVPWGWYLFAPVAVGVAASRVLLGVHYPSDVLVGALLGAALGLLAARLQRRWAFARRADD
jgi:undecaprenyl-diphosphatase